MGIAKVFIGLLVAVAAAALLLGGCVYSGYNQIITLNEAVKSGWAEVDNQLQRRFELIPNLVETVKGFAAQEKEIFLGVAKARESYFQSKTVGEKAQAANAFESALSRLLVLRETYPELKSNESFLKLQDTIEGTENRLSVARMRYNDAVNALNTYSKKLLGKLYASLAGVEEAQYFKISEDAKTAPKVDFSGSKGG